MKRLTTIICCVCLMIAGISLAVWDSPTTKQQTMMAAQPLQWNVPLGKLPLDLQLDLDKRLSDESSIKDSVHIRDSVRIIEKVRWKTRYKKDVADRTTARDEGKHLVPVTPDSMPKAPSSNSTLGREEQPNETVDVSKTPSIQLTVDGEVVYSRNDNHSGVESQP